QPTNNAPDLTPAEPQEIRSQGVELTRAGAGEKNERHSAPASPSETPAAMALLLALRKRWALALTLGLPCAAIAAAGWWFVSPPPYYSVRALVKLASTPEQILPGTPARDGGHFSDLQKTQISILKSRAVLKNMLAQPEVAELSSVTNQSDPLA